MDRLPNPDKNRYGESCSIVEFCSLVSLFTMSESLLPRQPILDVPPQPSRVKYELQVIYRNINRNATQQVNMSLLQEVNIQTTRAWLQSLLWQRALSNLLLDSQASEIIFTPEYPFTLAKDVLGFLSKIPLDLIRPHAYAMVSRFIHNSLIPANISGSSLKEVKLCQVAHTLLDIIMIVPSIRRACSSWYGPGDVVLAIESLLGSLFQRETETVALMRRRLGEAGFSQLRRSDLRLLHFASRDDYSTLDGHSDSDLDRFWSRTDEEAAFDAPVAVCSEYQTEYIVP
jgi:hypothetical protein